MHQFVSYLNFDGNARQAMEFYNKCLNGNLEVMPFDEKACGPLPPGAKDRVMHACLTIGGKPALMASDTVPGMPFVQGNNMYVSVHPSSKEETDRLFAALSQNGKVEMQLQDMFWGGYFGSFTDQFGIPWMFNFDNNAKA